jgi:hypothetical protein
MGYFHEIMKDMSGADCLKLFATKKKKKNGGFETRSDQKAARMATLWCKRPEMSVGIKFSSRFEN